MLYWGSSPDDRSGYLHHQTGPSGLFVNQIVRSPGVYYKAETDKNGRRTYNANLIPNRGAWLKFETDKNDLVWVRHRQNPKAVGPDLIKGPGAY